MQACRVSAAEFRRLWQSPDLSGDQIAAHFGVNRSTITGWARRYGLPLRVHRVGQPPVVPKARHAELLEMWRARVTMDAMGQHFGVNRRTIENTAKRLGAVNRGRSHGSTFLTLDQWHELQLARRMAETAREEQAALRKAGMVDGRHGKLRPDARPHWGRAA